MGGQFDRIHASDFTDVRLEAVQTPELSQLGWTEFTHAQTALALTQSVEHRITTVADRGRGSEVGNDDRLAYVRHVFQAGGVSTAAHAAPAASPATVPMLTVVPIICKTGVVDVERRTKA